MQRRGVILAAALIAAFLFGSPAKAEDIRIVADVWCPYNCAPGAKEEGFMVDIARRIFERKGMRVEYSTMPWSRAIELTRKGQYTAIVGAGYSDAPDFIFPQNIQAITSYGVYTRPGESWVYRGVSSLEKRTLGGIQDYAYVGEIDSYIRQHARDHERVQLISGEDGLQQNLRKLQAKRVDTFIENEFVIGDYFRRTGISSDTIRFAGYATASKPEDLYLFIAFGPDNPKAKEYAEMLSQGMQDLRASGELKRILANYDIKDWYPQMRR